MKMKVRKCELCSGEAAVFCPSDAAFLCLSCDTKVHEANFLVARHVRRAVVCTGDFLCLPEEEDDDLGSLSSSSTTSPEKAAKRRRVINYDDVKAAEGVLVKWCGELGVVMESGGWAAVRRACRGLKVCLAAAAKANLPFRVCLAASMWLGLRLTLHNSNHLLKRLQQISGVPAKIILAAHSKFIRPDRRHIHLQEGWAEC